ncbi:MAG: ABC transporter ATP-binding protein, partial [Acidimicrobiales bacterium]
DDLAAALAVLERAGIPARQEGDALRVDVAPSEAATVTRTLASADLWVTELRPEQVSLEDVFLELTGDPTGADGEEAA